MVLTIVIDSESFELNFFFAILPVCGMLSSRAWSDPIHVVRTFFSPETETAEKLRIAATNFYVSVSGRWTQLSPGLASEELDGSFQRDRLKRIGR